MTTVISIIVIVFFAAQGYRRGLLWVIFSLVSWIALLLFVLAARPYINEWLLQLLGARVEMMGIASALAFLVGGFLLHIIARFIGMVSWIPVVGAINRVLGAVAGTAKGVFLVWIVSYLVASFVK
jgi:uncharacterized membrane protein required for colicin V production